MPEDDIDLSWLPPEFGQSHPSSKPVYAGFRKMEPNGSMESRFRGQKVQSSTCNRPQDHNTPMDAEISDNENQEL